MKNSKNIFFLFGLILFVACQNGQKIFSNDETRIRQFDAAYEVKGEVFLDDEYGILDLIAVGDYLALTSVKRENVFFLYDPDGTKLGAFGTIGHGPDELLNCRYTGQIEKDESGCKIWINDVSNSSLKLIDLDSSRRAGKIVAEKTIPFPGPAANCYYGNDSLLYVEKWLNDNYEMARYNYQTGKNEAQKLYRQPVNKPFSVYKGIWRKHPRRTVMVNAMHSLNRINILNMSDGTRIALIVGEDNISLENAVDKNSGLEKHTYYCDLAVSEDRIYALWMDQPYEDAYETPKTQEIHVFDWNGRPKARLKVPEYICGFTVDEKSRTAYGITHEEIIYRYRLPEIR